MNTTHLTEEEIQQYALDDTAISISVAEHIHSCEYCKEKAEAYRLLFSGLQQQPLTSFDFNLEALIMSQLPAPATKPAKENVFIYIFITAAIAITGFAFYFFREYLTNLFESMASVFIYLAITAFTTLSILLIADMYKKYKKKIHTLDLYTG